MPLSADARSRQNQPPKLDGPASVRLASHDRSVLPTDSGTPSVSLFSIISEAALKGIASSRRAALAGGIFGAFVGIVLGIIGIMIRGAIADTITVALMGMMILALGGSFIGMVLGGAAGGFVGALIGGTNACKERSQRQINLGAANSTKNNSNQGHSVSA